MSLSLYDTSVGVFIRQLKNLSAVLQKAETWCDDNGKPHAELLEARLSPDMYPLTSQIRLAARWARNGALLNEGYAFKATDGKPELRHTFAELQQLVHDAMEFLQAVRPEDIAGAENRPVSVWSSGEEGQGHNVKLDAGHKLLSQVIFPNFWFHDSMAYAICRMKGVPVGKLDFLMGGAGPVG
ncbi:uncharacterized protein BKCO1_500057 [Diplodia corticola]|uniref:Helix-turn-helix-domain containing protein type n=1 Tax=Diplodia corticola TaxID=236234 RepID=A0A1J9SEL5_9PEZI|nr:uncharacterized protein BKCO1_500057 [Diplodia corticola]OJD38021.1 hypothetical protein BKCO1_500057 [Diplodia corticola]